MTGERAKELAEKFLTDCIFDINDKSAVYEYNIDGLVEFVKDGILVGCAESSKDFVGDEKK